MFKLPAAAGQVSLIVVRTTAALGSLGVKQQIRHWRRNYAMTTSAPTPPKVFISYSWSSDDHTAWVADLGERLMTDGIIVVLDQWDLQDGQDLNDFMEQMVKDPDIKRVIIVSDSLYATKADGRKGGVGTETQIISQEVYDSVDQVKFIPILRERDTDGKACLPVYLRSRKYIDFSDPYNDAEAYDQLLRNIFERPRRPKPMLGKAPTHIFDDDATVVSSAQKAKRFREFAVSGKGNSLAAFEDFSEEFISNLEALRMTYSRDEANTWCQRIRENIDSATAHRDVLVDVLRAAIGLPSNQFMPPLLSLLERILPLGERPEGVSSFFECSEDNYKLLCYEMFLYVMAVLTKAKKYSEARELIDFRYVAPRTYGGNELDGHGFNGFNNHARSLEEQCGVEGNQRRYSMMAFLIHERATNKHIRFSDVLQADVLLWIAGGDAGWFPRCLVYGGSAGKLELFVRAVTVDGYQPLRTLLQIKTPQEFVQRLLSQEVMETLQYEMFSFSRRGSDTLNLEELKRRWGPLVT